MLHQVIEKQNGDEVFRSCLFIQQKKFLVLSLGKVAAEAGIDLFKKYFPEQGCQIFLGVHMIPTTE
jgi:hypothetical protein